VKTFADGSGDISIALKAPTKIPFLHLWPHVRPGKLKTPEPTFRAVPNASAVATLLADALGAEAQVVETPVETPALEPALS
jgi:hypothetical protein